MRSFTNAGKQSLYEHNTDEIWLMLLTITATTGTYRFVNNNEDVTSEDPVTKVDRHFKWYPFEITIPPDDFERAPTATLTISNVDQLLVDTLREISEPPEFKIELIRHSQPNIIEMTVDNLIMRTAAFDALAITATLEVDDIFNVPYPSGTGTYSPRQFPGMF